MSMPKEIHGSRRIRFLVWLALAIFLLFGYSLQNTAGSAYYFLIVRNYATVNTPPVILEGGTAGISTIYTNSTSAKASVEAPLFDYVDNNESDVDSSADKGMHSSFLDQQAGPDSAYDTLKEENTETIEDYVDQQSNVDGSTDVGTHGNFSAQKHGPNSTFDTLTEADTGSPESWTSPTSFSDPDNDWSTETYAYDEGTGTRAACSMPSVETGYQGYLILYLDADITSSKCRWRIVTGSRFDGFQVDVGNDGVYNNVYSSSSPTEGTWVNTSYTERTVDAIRFRFSKSTGNGGDNYLYETDVLKNAVVNYKLDLEVQWTNVQYLLPNENLSICGGTLGDEDLRVDVWNGTDWETVFTNLSSGWNNASITDWLTTSNFTIRFEGGNETGDPGQDSWQIDVALIHIWTTTGENYELDLEVQWTSADSTRTNEELCIKTGTFSGSENIQVKVWNNTGSSWHWVMNLTANQWNNVSIASYLTSSTFTVQFLGGTETSDTTQDSWNIDATFLHVWTIESPYDYVDNNIYDVDSSPDKGTHSNFTAQQYGPDSVYDILTEANTGGITYRAYASAPSQGSLTITKPTGTVQNDVMVANIYVVGTSPTITAPSGWTLVLSTLDGTTARLSTYYKVAGASEPASYQWTFSGASMTEGGIITFYGVNTTNPVDVYGGQANAASTSYTAPSVTTTVSNAMLVAAFGAKAGGSSNTVTPPPGMTERYDIGQDNNGLSCTEAANVVQASAGASGTKVATGQSGTNIGHLVALKPQPANYELDLEVQWTSATYNLPNEELCIFGGTMGTEDIRVDVWNGTAWQNLFTDLTNGWNNVSVSSYLTSSNFTVRFKGDNETGDTTQDNSYIDTTLLHVWPYVETTYDYVLRVNNTVTDSWEIRLKEYSNSSVGRLQNCTIYFHNSTDGNSPQIVVENGSFKNETGSWYNLGSSQTIYIAITVEASSTGTSYIYAYLEVRTPNTTTYARHTITFEIT